MIVNILYSLDEKGFDLFLVSLYSLLKNKHSHTKYAITITHNGLEQQIIKITQKLVDYFTNTTIRFIDCSYWNSKYDLDKISKESHPVLKLSWPSPMYYYFLSGLFYEKDIHKIIYLDIDTVIQKDLTTFYEFKFSKIFCAMKCNVIIPYIQHQNSVKTLIGEEALEKIAVKFSHFITNQIGKYDNYSNSGVLLINLELLRTINLDDLFKIAHEKKFNDQDLLSYYFWNQLDNFDIKYNFCIHFFTDEIVVKQLKLNNITMDNLNNFLDFAHVVHVSIRPKPTFFFNFKYSRLINKYGNIQNFINVISKPDFYIEKYSIHLAESEKEEITTLNKTWIYRLYKDTQKTRLYERVFYQWGLLWVEVLQKLASGSTTR